MQRMTLLRQAEAILKENPRNRDMLAQSGILYMADGNMKQAIDRLQAAHKLDKKNPTVISHLINAYNQAKQYQGAKKFARKLVDLAPRNGDYLKVYAENLEYCGQYEQALQAWQRLMRQQPGATLPVRSYAECLRTMGRMSEALEWFAKALELDPLEPASLYMIAQSKRHSAEEVPAMVERIERSIAKTEDVILRANLHFGAGKILTDAGRYDEAFEHYRRANESRLEATPAEREHAFRDSLRKTQNAMACYDKTLFAEKAGLGDSWDAPIFILGMPRSGTTLTESLVAGHSLVVAGDELAYIGRITKGTGQNDSEPAAVTRLLRALGRKDLEKMAEFYRESTAGIWKKNKHFTDKMPHNFQSMGMIRILFPNARIIHCRRHPIDNCLSIYTNSMNETHNRYKSDLHTLGLYYRQYLRLMQHWRDVLPGGFHEVFYEDMVANTEYNARSIMEYLGLEWEDAIMDRDKSQKHVRTLSAWQVRQPVYTSSAGRWRKFETHLGPLIDALGPVVEEYENELAAIGGNK